MQIWLRTTNQPSNNYFRLRFALGTTKFLIDTQRSDNIQINLHLFRLAVEQIVFRNQKQIFRRSEYKLGLFTYIIKNVTPGITFYAY